MRFQQALELEKRRTQQEERNERLEKHLDPLKSLIQRHFNSSQAWFNPVAASLERLKQAKPELRSNMLPIGVPSTQNSQQTVQGSSASNGAVATLHRHDSLRLLASPQMSPRQRLKPISPQ